MEPNASFSGISDNSSADSASGALCGGDDLMVFRFICEVVISLPVAVLGVLGNSLAFAVLCWHEQKGATNILLRCLAVADTFALLSAIVLRSLRYWHICLGGLHAYNAVYGYIFCWLYPSVYFIRLFDVCVTVLLTVERYIAVSYPFRAQHWCSVRLTYRYIIAVGIFSMAFSVPRFFEYKVNLEDPSEFDYTGLLQNRFYTILYRIVLFFLIMYLIPMAMLIVLNAGLWRALKKAILRRTSMQRAGSDSVSITSRNYSTRHSTRSATTTTTSSSPSSPSASITVMVLVVVLVCIICNVTAMVSHLLWSLYECFEHLAFLELYRRYLANISNVFININSGINFAIYCFCSRSFRDHLWGMLRCSGCCKCDCRDQTQKGLLLVKSKLCVKHANSFSRENCGPNNIHKTTVVLYSIDSQRTLTSV